MKIVTLLFLVKRTDGNISDICLAMKKRGFGVGRWNGVGGKVSEGETIEAAAIREAQEEICVTPRNIKKVAELFFTFPINPAINHHAHTYICEEWEGEPAESEEMKPQWYKISDIPYAQMWPDDKFWLPMVLEGKIVKNYTTFGEKDVIVEQRVEIVSSL